MTQYAMRVSTPLVPPKKYINHSYHHWVTRIDFDGRTCGLEIYQWQPYAKKWCLPNEYASGRDKDLLDYQWVALCPIPAFEEESKEFLTLLDDIKERFKNNTATVKRVEYDTLRMFIMENTAMRRGDIK